MPVIPLNNHLIVQGGRTFVGVEIVSRAKKDVFNLGKCDTSWGKLIKNFLITEALDRAVKQLADPQGNLVPENQGRYTEEQINCLQGEVITTIIPPTPPVTPPPAPVVAIPPVEETVPPCVPSWTCTDWGACVGGRERRVCTDSNNCGTTVGKPVEIRSCTPPVPPPCSKFLTFTSETDLFKGSITKSSTQIANPEWDFGDGSAVIKALSVSHNYSSKEERIIKICFGDFRIPRSLTLSGIGIKGTLDLTRLTELTSYILSSNPELDKVIFPVTPPKAVFANVNLISLTGCNITGTLDLSFLTTLTGTLLVISNPNLDKIVFPSTSLAMSKISAFNCPKLTELDITPIQGVSNNITIQVFNNLMTETTVNKLFIDLDNKGWINGKLQILQGNDAPSGAGITSKNNLINNKGWAIT